MQITQALQPSAIEGKFHMFLLLAVILMSGSLAVRSAVPHLDAVNHIFTVVGDNLLESAPYYS